MNKSIFSKNQITGNFGGKNSNRITFSNLSATSSDFMSQINPRRNMRGGNDCPCTKCLEAFEEGNIELALYIFKEGNCCCRCKDNKGNTILHNLIICANSGSQSDRTKCKEAIKNLIDSDIIGDCINVQNNEGVTPFLLAVMKGDEKTAQMLDSAGADKSIKDKNGNYVKDEDDNSSVQSTYDSDIDRLLKAKRRLDSEDGMSTLDLGSDIRRLDSSEVPQMHNNKSMSIMDALNDYGKMLIIANDKNPFPERTAGNDDVVFAEIRSTQPAHDEPINLVDAEKINNIMNNLMNDVETKDTVIPRTTTTPSAPAAPAVARTTSTPAPPTTTKVTEPEMLSTDEGSRIDLESDTDQLLRELKKEYEKRSTQESAPRPQPTSTTIPVTQTVNPTTTTLTQAQPATQTDRIDTDVDTEALMEAISKISSKKDTQQGGNKEKLSGYRRLIETSEEEVTVSETSNSEYSLNSDYEALYYDEKEGGASNELSRMMQSQKDKLHEQVLDMIMSMLNKGELIKDSEPIKANERNAKLIKAYIYRQVSEKNPQLGGLDKILMMSKMSDSQIQDMVQEMPELDDLEKTIQKHLEEKQANRPAKSAKSEKKSKKEKAVTDESDTLADLTLSETVETTDSETPKKKKATKTTKAKKTSKK